VIVHISLNMRDGRQTKQATRSQRLMIVHISFGIRDGRQTGNQKSATSDCSYFIWHQRWKANRQSRDREL
jgi:5-carboxymethyl-2-hydroxymuconate isomerase